MAYSTQRAVSDGTMAYLDVSIQYMKRADINVFYDGLPANPTTWAWVGTTDKRIAFTPNVPNGVEVLLKRTTQINTIINVFSNGAKFNNSTMDQDFTQLLYLNQEAVEGAALTDIFNDVDFHGYKIKNLGVAVDANDAITYGQVQTMSTGAYQAQLAAQAARDDAQAARDLARAWASQLTTTVDGTSYSAKQYALNSVASANAAAASASAASGSAGAASASATDAHNSAVDSSQYAGFSHDDSVLAAASASAASGSATAAANSATAAAGSAATAAGFRFNARLAINTSQTLTASFRGAVMQWYGGSSGTVTLEEHTAGGGIPSGTPIWIFNNGGAPLTIASQNSDRIYNGQSLNTSITLNRLEDVILVYNGPSSTEIDVVGGGYFTRTGQAAIGITMTGGRITGLGAPTAAGEVANKAYVDGNPLKGPELVASGNLSGVTVLTLPFDTKYTHFELEIEGLKGTDATGRGLLLQFYNSGAVIGANLYAYAFNFNVLSAASTPAASGAGSQAAAVIMGGLSNGANRSMSFTAHFPNPRSTTKYKTYHGVFSGVLSDDQLRQGTMGGICNSNTAADSVLLFIDNQSAMTTGTYRFYGKY